MDRVAVLFAAVVPALFFLAYGVSKARGGLNEALANAFALGAVGAIAALLIELGLSQVIHFQFLPPLLNAAAGALVMAAIPEETVKFVILIGMAERHVDARRLQDIVVLALGVSLGFAALENLFYLVEPSQWQWIAAGRATTAVPGHGIDGLAMGALVTAARVHPNLSRQFLVLALAVPVALHAAYDFPLFAIKENRSVWLLLLWTAIVLLSAVLVVVLCNRVLPQAAERDRASGRDKKPVNSGRPLVIGGAIMLALAPACGVLVFYLKGIAPIWPGAALGVIPVVLGLDLIWSGARARAGAACGRSAELSKRVNSPSEKT